VKHNEDEFCDLTFGECGITMKGYRVCAKHQITVNKYEILRSFERMSEAAAAVRKAMRHTKVLLEDAHPWQEPVQLAMMVMVPESKPNFAETN